MIGKEEVKLSLFTYARILYTENPKATTKNLLEYVSFNKFATYNINIQKTTVFLHTSNEQSKNKETTPFITALKLISI